MNRAKIRATVLTTILVFVAYLSMTLSPTTNTVGATPGPVDVSVNPSPVPAGQSFHIVFKVNYQFQGQAAATVEIGTCTGCSDVWKSQQMGVSSGQSYDVTAPGISAPGSYFVTVVVIIPSSMGGVAVGGNASFQVLASTQTQTVSSTSQTTTSAVSATTTTSEAPLKFSISVSPTEQTVTPGQSAAYVVMVDLVSGAAVTVDLSIQETTAGITASFDPQSGKLPYTSLLTVSTTQSVSSGQVAMEVTGSGGGQTETADFTLNIAGQAQTTSSQTASSQNETVPFMGLIQQNYLIMVWAIAIIAIAAVVLRARKPKPISKPTVPQSSGVCASCGTQNSPTDEFCMNCGRKLA